MFFKGSLYAFHFWILLLTQFSEANAVVVNITTVDETNTTLPSDIRVTVSTDINTTTVLNLRKVEHIDGNVPVYSIDTQKDGSLKVTKETEPEDKKLAYYQDLSNHAVMQIAQHTDVTSSEKKFSVARGEYVKNNKKYAITPRLHNKKEALPDGNQLDESYDVNEMPISMVADLNPILPPSKKSLLKNKRFKRQVEESTFYIDVTAFLDSSRYNIFLKQASYSVTKAMKNIQEYYAFIFSGIDLIYQNFNANNYYLRVSLTKIITFKEIKDFPLVYIPTYFLDYDYTQKVDTDKVLAKFGQFLTSSAGKDLTFPYDHAMLFIGSDLWMEDIDLLGLASGFGTLCNKNGTSSTAVEDMGDYSADLTGAHELGHILLAQHDGYENNCKYTDRYLMASSDSHVTNTTLTHPWRFSNCTIDYIETFITNLLQTTEGRSCLYNTLDIMGEFPDVSNRYLGQEIPPEQQCRLTFGYSSGICPFKPPSFPCAELYCSSGLDCYSRFISPLAGTICGCGKVCYQGECVLDLYSPDASCDIWSNCSFVSCNDETSSLYCKHTCGGQPVSPRIKSSTTKRTTWKTITTTKLVETTECRYEQRCTISSCQEVLKCGVGTNLSHTFLIIYAVITYFIMTTLRVKL